MHFFSKNYIIVEGNISWSVILNFTPYPFEKLQDLIKHVIPKKTVVKLTIGEPQFPTPKIIQDALKNHVNELRFYPKSGGETYLYDAIKNFIAYRYSIAMENQNIIPTFGTREVLFNFPQFFLSQFQAPVIAYPNPFYQIYEGASIASMAKIILMDMNKENNFTPSLTQEQMEEANLVILNSPNNPTGKTLDLKDLQQWIENAQKYNFVLLNDECYSEIYKDIPPIGILEASYLMGNKKFKNILCINSISKRLSSPGLRSGYIAGDPQILKSYRIYRTYLGCAIPNPLQRAASIAWTSHKEAEQIRQKYAKNLEIAQNIFQETIIFPYSFYIWLYVGDDLKFCIHLYEKEGILVLPGRFLGRNGMGVGYVRIALVYEPKFLTPILKRIKNFLKKGLFETN